tara:strand:- start:344 stop:691 length:348 start_codon:yes stop_codon:yes gene_type:complete
MKTTIERVFETLNKVELKSEKVELNKVEDTIKDAGKIGGKILGIESDILASANEIKSLSSKYDKYIKELKQYQKIAKELGVDKMAKDAAEAVAHYENKIKKADKMLQNVKAAIKK